MSMDVVLSRWEGLEGARPEPLGAGLINETFLLRGRQERSLVLQRVSPIFDPRIHENIQVVTERLTAMGLETPRLVPARDGALWVEPDSGEGVYRVMTWVPGTTFDVVDDLEQARAAGGLIGRFHRALEGLDYDFVGRRLGVHDTAAHLERLRGALDDQRGHRLRAEVEALAEQIFERVEAMEPLLEVPERVCHGDLKLNNVRFAGPEPPESQRARALIDLDTVGPMQLAYELGDAWRSWCNRAGEDEVEGRFDLEVFAASLEGYREGRGGDLGRDEARSLLGGVEWVSLELSARFAADALLESYFGWDESRYPAAGEHNLVRARGQMSLHRAVVATRSERARLLGVDATAGRGGSIAGKAEGGRSG